MRAAKDCLTTFWMYQIHSPRTSPDVAIKVPVLFFFSNNPNPNGKRFVKFDGFRKLANGSVELIDSKTRIVPFATKQGPFISPSVRDSLTRKSLAIGQNSGVVGVIELPTASARKEAQHVLRQLGIKNILTRVRP